MVSVVLFHHVMGLTDGVRRFAGELESDGVAVHAPDLYGGEVASSLEEGFSITKRIGEETLARRVEDVLAEIPQDLVYAGMSSGVMTAQKLAQTRPGALGALLYEACVPITGDWAFGPWPEGVPVQVHGMDDDEFFAHEGDIDAARELVGAVEHGELFTYPGDSHLFLDSSLPSFDLQATELALERSRAFLDRLR
ncbi:MAG TPA: dienelactone hydrolase family protein [Acidimicrobiia bacterium]|nr:dienelactone hydrolase family protein [Acidimicrobiia bacterium]